MGRILTPRRALVLVMVVAAGYGAAMIRDTSFITGGKRYTTLHDDMMISMSYAANLVAGNGCVWTRGGERLMGITNPGWILVMTIPFLLGASKAAAPVFIEVLGLLLALGSAWFAGKIARKLSGSETVRLAATALVGMSYVLLQYSVL